MNIAITGGTGVLGSAVAEELRQRGHEIRLLSRTPPRDSALAHHRIDLSSAADGELDAALGGVDVLVDAHNTVTRKAVEALMVRGSGRLNEAAARVGVGHHVVASIVGIDGRRFTYYRAKVAQEQAALDGPAPTTVVRITQFHTLLDMALSTAASKARVRPTGRLRFQTIDPADAARAMADVAEGEPLAGRLDVGGPQVLTLAEMSEAWRQARGRRLLPVRVPALFGDLRDVAGGALTNPAAAVAGGRTWQEYLAGAPVLVR